MAADGPAAAGRPTLEVVAARAGVSRATASRVLRGASNVSAAAREAVMRAADDVSYTVNRAARSLVTRRSDSIAFLVAETQERTFHDPYFLSLLRGAQAEAATAGVQMVFVIAATGSEVDQFERFAAGGHVDGVLLVSMHGDDSLAEDLERLGVPTVINGRPFDSTELFSVDADNVGGAREATELLVARGCRTIATITGPRDMNAGQDRLRGFCEALEQAALHIAPERVVEGDFSVAGGRAAMEALLATGSEMDGLFVASDLMALGAMRLLSERGVRVPQDLAVVGFDDVREAHLVDPPLTTVRQPVDDIGRTLTRVLLDRLDGEQPATRTVLPTDLVRRGSA